MTQGQDPLTQLLLFCTIDIWGQSSWLWGCPVCCRMCSSIPAFPIRRQQHPTPSDDNQKHPRTLLNFPWGQNCPILVFCLVFKVTFCFLEKVIKDNCFSHY